MTPSTTIRVYNTLSKNKEPFVPVAPGKVGIYLCGPTVYKESHIGHAVGPVIFDTISRYLKYSGYDVTWVVNITDVDDKLIAQSRERGVPMDQIAAEMTIDYLNNMAGLGVDQITHMPRATDHMPGIIQFITDLIAKGHAYASGSDVFFDVAKDPGYGKLSNRSADEQQGEGGGAASKKRNPGDFALWKSAKPGEPSWESPWGPGRPGWHIECSAMSRALLGETFDIHGGGLDLLFPHHENEIAQSRDDGKFDAGGDPLLEELQTLRQSFLDKMDDDFNTGGAMADLFEIVRALNKYADEHKIDRFADETLPPHDIHHDPQIITWVKGTKVLRELSNVLGLFRTLQPKRGGGESLVPKLVELFIALRKEAREKKD